MSKIHGISFETVGSHDSDPFKAQDETDDIIEIRVLDYLEEFTKALFDSLVAGEKKYGNQWLRLSREGQEKRIFNHFDNKIAEYFGSNKPLDWASIAGNAMIAWIRENHPELFNDPD